MSDEELKPYLNCRKLLGGTLTDLLARCKARRINKQRAIDACATATDRIALMSSLKSLGLPLEDIGKIAALSRERIRQLITEVDDYDKWKFKSENPAAVIDWLALEELTYLLLQKPEYWHDIPTKTGKIAMIKMEAVIDTLQDRMGGHREEIRKKLQELNLRKTEVALIGIGVRPEVFKRWVLKQYDDGWNSVEIVGFLNRIFRPQISEMAWSDFIKRLGIIRGKGNQTQSPSIQEPDWVTRWVNAR